jgi:hypothetical protein
LKIRENCKSFQTERKTDSEKVGETNYKGPRMTTDFSVASKETMEENFENTEFHIQLNQYVKYCSVAYYVRWNKWKE